MTTIVHPRDVEDPRPVLVETAGTWYIKGFRCEACDYRVAAERPRCPVCRAGLSAFDYGPEGVVWAATVLRAGVPDREPPFGLAYVDLDDGPRVLCHIEANGNEPELLAPGTRVALAGLTDRDDPKVRIL